MSTCLISICCNSAGSLPEKRLVINRSPGADPGEVKWVNFHHPPPPISEPSSFFFFLIPQILIGSITWLQKFTPLFQNPGSAPEAYSILRGIFQGSNKAWATPRLVSFRGIIQMFQPFHIGVPSPGRKSCLSAPEAIVLIGFREVLCISWF